MIESNKEWKVDCPSCGKKNVEPVKSWSMKGRGGVVLTTYQFQCRVCGFKWRLYK